MWFDIMKALFFLQISWFRAINDKPPRPKSLDTTRLLQAAGAQVFHPECLKGWRSEKRYPVSRYPLSKLAPLRQRPRAAALPPEVKKANGWKKISARSLDRDPFTVSSSNIFKKKHRPPWNRMKISAKKRCQGPSLSSARFSGGFQCSFTWTRQPHHQSISFFIGQGSLLSKST